MDGGRASGDLMNNAMNAVIIRQVVCENCGAPTWHLDSTLDKLIQHQSVMTNEGRRINYACPSCTALTSSLLGKAQPVPQGEVSRFLAGLDSYIGSLECATPNCESRVILLVPSKGEPDIADWRIDDAACEKGLLPKYPFQGGEWLRLP